MVPAAQVTSDLARAYLELGLRKEALLSAARTVENVEALSSNLVDALEVLLDPDLLRPATISALR